MPPRPTHDPSYLDEHHQRISEFAADYFDDEEERGAFVDTLMERRGYARTAGWSLPAPAGGGGGQGGGGQPRKHPYFKQ